MAIASLDDYIGSAKQMLSFFKYSTRSTAAGGWYTVADLAGTPRMSSLAGSSTTQGVVPVDTDSGFPVINSFSSGDTGYLSRVNGGCVAAMVVVFDLLFKAGAYAYNANTGLTSQPSYSGRLPGSSYEGLEIWVEAATNISGNIAVEATYTNEGGTGSRTTAAAVVNGPSQGRCWNLPLQAGDRGVQKIDNVKGTGAFSGTFNVLVMRRLFISRPSATNIVDVANIFKTGMPQVFDDSAIYPLVRATGNTNTGLLEVDIEIASA